MRCVWRAPERESGGNVSATVPTDGLAIQARGLSKLFGEHVAVDGVDLSVREGELFSLLGPNGAGKTTTIKMLCCLSRPSSGTAAIMGHDIAREPLAVKQVIGTSPQETAVAEHLNARENLALMGRIHGCPKGELERRSDELLDVVGLSERAHEQVKKFSGGMKRRLSIAMALVSDPQVLFLDEPTLGLDPQARRKVWDYVAQLKGEKTMFLTTHYLEEADALADRVMIVDEGKSVALGTPGELKTGVAEGEVMVVKARNLSADVIAGLRARYAEVKEIPGGVEIRAPHIDLYALQDYLRPAGVVLESTYSKESTLDDVFLRLTGREFRE
jgi:ABC-2 type transport system ATP-binding protein